MSLSFVAPNPGRFCTLLLLGLFIAGAGCTSTAPPPAQAGGDAESTADVGADTGLSTAALGATSDKCISIDNPANNTEFVFISPTTTINMDVSVTGVTLAAGGHYYNVYVDGELLFNTTDTVNVEVFGLPKGLRHIAVQLVDPDSDGPNSGELTNSCARDGVYIKVVDSCTTVADCSDGLSCSNEACSAGQCGYGAVTDCCDSDLECENGWFCEDNTCKQCKLDSECDDGNSCTQDFCDPDTSQCTNTLIDGCCNTDDDCDDELFCTTDFCDGNECEYTQVADPSCCDADADCVTDDPCILTTCYISQSKGIQTCRTGPANPNCCTDHADCDDGNACTLDSCFIAPGDLAGECSFVADPEQPDCCVDKGDCDDGDPFTIDACVDNLCQNIVDEAFCVLPDPVGIVINEVMAAPGDLSDDEAEWFEIYNTGEDFVAIHNWTIETSIGGAVQGTHTINAPTLDVPPGAYVTLSRFVNKTLTGFTSHYGYGDEIDLLDPFEDPGFQVLTLTLRDKTGAEVDSITYDVDYDLLDSRSLERRNPYFDSDDASTWRAAGTAVETSKNRTYGPKANKTFGSPRTFNNSSFLGVIDDTCELPEGSDLCSEARCNLNNECEFIKREDCCLEDDDCDDGNPCTTQQCIGGDVNECTAPVEVANCCLSNSECDDSNTCNIDRCIGNRCRFSANVVAGCCFADGDCDDGNPCTVNTCNAETAECNPGAEVNDCCIADSQCDDGEPSTLDTCNLDPAAGDVNVCVNGPDPDYCEEASDPCDDGDPCTTDSCSVAAQLCSHLPIPGCCASSDECPGDNNDCTQAVCLDDNTCDQEPIAGCCLEVGDCDDDNPCTEDFCNATNICHYRPVEGCCENDTECNDGDACTNDVCNDGLCVNDQQIGCCHEEASEGELIEQCGPHNDVCDVWNCVAGECVEDIGGGCCEEHVDCDDGNECTINFCQAGNTCKTLPLTTGGCCSSNFNCANEEYCNLALSQCQPKLSQGELCLGDQDCETDVCTLGECSCPAGFADDPEQPGEDCLLPVCVPECLPGFECTVDGCVRITPGWNRDVQPILEAKCGDCHDGDIEETCEGETCFVHFFSDVAKDSNSCAGQSVADCMLVLLEIGQEPQGAGCTGEPALDAGKPECLTGAELRTIENWLDNGQDCGPDGLPCDFGDVCVLEGECDSGECIGVTPCDNSGACTVDGNLHLCSCSDGYAGVNCEIDVDACTDGTRVGPETLPITGNNSLTDLVILQNPATRVGCVESVELVLATTPSGNGVNWEARVYELTGTAGVLRGKTGFTVDTAIIGETQTIELPQCLDIELGWYVGVTNLDGDTELAFTEEGAGYLFFNDAGSDVVDGDSETFNQSLGGIGFGGNIKHVAPCQNGSTCVDHEGEGPATGYTCECLPGFEGTNCEIDGDNCDPNPCVNGGTCTDNTDDYTCTCPPGFSGKDCEVDEDECTVTQTVGPETLPDTNASSSHVVINAEGAPIDGCIRAVTLALGDLPDGDGSDWEFRIYETNFGFSTLIASTPIAVNPNTTNEQTIGIEPCLDIEAGQKIGILNNDGATRLRYSLAAGEGYLYLTKAPGDDIGDSTAMNTWSGDSGFKALMDRPACDNGAICTDLADDFSCECLDGFTGDKTCDVDIDECICDNIDEGQVHVDSSCGDGVVNPCQNGATCTDLVYDYACECPPGFEGIDCEIDVNNCGFEPCENGSVCSDLDEEDDYECTCEPGYKGKNCEQDFNNCALTGRVGNDELPAVSEFLEADLVIQQEPVEYDGCIDTITLRLGSGVNGAGEGWVVQVFDVDYGPGNPATNQATLVASLETDDVQNFANVTQVVQLSECLDVLKGQYIGLGNTNGPTNLTFVLEDTDGDGLGYWTSDSQPSETIGSETTVDAFKYGVVGFRANLKHPVLCQNGGACVDLVDHYECVCPNGYEGYDCEIDIDECALGLCENGSICVDEVFDYSCLCPDGYDGKNCEIDLDECDPDPCVNGGDCTDLVFDYFCECPDGYSGKDCEVNDDECDPVQWIGEHLLAEQDGDSAGGTAFIQATAAAQDGVVSALRARVYVAPPGVDSDAPGSASTFYVGVFTDNGGNMDLAAWELVDLDTNSDQEQSFIVGDLPIAAGQYVGVFSTDGDFYLTASGAGAGYWTSGADLSGLDIGGSIASTDLESADGEVGFRADIPLGLPCQNGSICTDEVFDYSCACLPGYSDKNCSTNDDECDPHPCNESECVDLVNDFQCECSPGYIGEECEIDSDDCADQLQYGINANDFPVTNQSLSEVAIISTPAEDPGCIDEITLRLATLSPGGAYELRTYELYAETVTLRAKQSFTFNQSSTSQQTIEMSPCLPINEGQFVALANTNGTLRLAHTSTGGAGYWALQEEAGSTVNGEAETFMRLEGDIAYNVNIDFDHPCENGATCVDLLDDYECICPPGFTGRDCEINVDECTCEDLLDPELANDQLDLTDGTCADGATQPSPCVNGSCNDFINNYTCDCEDGWSGYNCDINDSECDPDPCLNGSTCVDGVFDYECLCLDGFEGKDCEINLDECADDPCQNGAECLDLVFDYFCECPDGYSGKDCEVNDDECSPVVEFGPHLLPPTEDIQGDVVWTDDDVVIWADAAEFTSCVDSVRVRFGAPPEGGSSGLELRAYSNTDGVNAELLAFHSLGDLDPDSRQEQIIAIEPCFLVFEGEGVGIGNYNGDLNITIEPGDNDYYFRNEGSAFFVGDIDPVQFDTGDVGFRADMVEFPAIDDSRLSPCLNGAACVDNVFDYTCECEPGYFGKDCQIDINECETDTPIGPGDVPNTGASQQHILIANTDVLLSGCVDEVSFALGSNPPGNELGWEVRTYTMTGDEGVLRGTRSLEQVQVSFGNLQTFAVEPCLPISAFDSVALVNTDGQLRVGEDTEGEGSYWALATQPNAVIGGPAETFVRVSGVVGFNAHVAHTLPCVNGSSCNDLVNNYSCTCPDGYDGYDCQNDLDECVLGMDGLDDGVGACEQGDGAAGTPLWSDCCDDGSKDFAREGRRGCDHNGCEASVCELDPACCGDVWDAGCVVLAELACNDLCVAAPVCTDGVCNGDEDCESCPEDCLATECTNGAECVDGAFDYSCNCAPGFDVGDKDCDVNINNCLPDPCVNGGECVDLIDNWACICPEGYGGNKCQVDLDDCEFGPCENPDPLQVGTGGCTDLLHDYSCACEDGYEGKDCEIDTNECDTNVEAVQIVEFAYDSGCLNLDDLNNQVLPAGSAACDFTFAYNADARRADVTSGDNTIAAAIDDFAVFLVADAIAANDVGALLPLAGIPFEGGWVVLTDNGTFYKVELTDTKADHVELQFLKLPVAPPSPCQNGAVCTDLVFDYHCACTAGFAGKDCESDVDNCGGGDPDLNPCQNGAICTDLVDSYSCDCPDGYEGTNCEINIDECGPAPCLNGSVCEDLVFDYFCHCEDGFEGKNCEVDIDECEADPCQNGAPCEDLVFDYFCHCLDGYSGKNCQTNDDECAPDDELGPHLLPPTGALGAGAVVNTQPNPDLVCIDRVKVRFNAPPEGGAGGIELRAYVYDEGFDDLDLLGRQAITVDPDSTEDQIVAVEPCFNLFPGENLGLANLNGALNVTFDNEPYDANPCCEEQGGAGCADDARVESCVCAKDSFCCEVDWDSLCVEAIDAMGCAECSAGYVTLDDPSDDVQGGFEPVDDSGTLAGLQAANPQPNPCDNGSTCTDLVFDYSCACPNGFSGKDCETDDDECALGLCQNDSACTDLVFDYHCTCPDGIVGEDCEVNSDECLQTAILGPDTLPTGGAIPQADLVVYREPNQIDGCIDSIEVQIHSVPPGGGAGFELRTYTMFAHTATLTGKRSVPINGNLTNKQTIAVSPCFPIAQGEFLGIANTNGDLRLKYNANAQPGLWRKASNLNHTVGGAAPLTPNVAGAIAFNAHVSYEFPCVNGSACNDDGVLDDYNCECLAGFDGKNCEIDLDDCDPDPCLNGSTCVDGIDSYSCECLAGYEGQDCQINTDDCDPDPCQNFSTCVDLVDDYSCTCEPGFDGKDCEININECDPDQCVNGSCIDGINTFVCSCDDGWDGALCDNNIDECDPDPCQDGTCVDLINDFECDCDPGFRGELCEVNINECLQESLSGPAVIPPTGASTNEIMISGDQALKTGCIESVTFRLGSPPDGFGGDWDVRVYTIDDDIATLIDKRGISFDGTDLSEQTVTVSPCLPVAQGQYIGVANNEGRLRLAFAPEGNEQTECGGDTPDGHCIGFWYLEGAAFEQNSNATIGESEAVLNNHSGVPGFHATLSFDDPCPDQICNDAVDGVVCEDYPCCAFPLMITGVIDGDSTGGKPKGVELFACQDIPDLSVYALGTANNGGGTDGAEFSLPAESLGAGQRFYVSSDNNAESVTAWNNYFGFQPDFANGDMNVNGNDAVELFWNGDVIDTFGDLTYTSGTSQPWHYGDGYAARKSDTGGDGAVFDINNWNIGDGSFDGLSSSGAAAIVDQNFGTYTCGDIGTP